MDVMGTLRDRRAKAQARVARASKALEIAEKELEDLIAAERVMAEITGESISGRPTASTRDTEITRLLSSDRTEARTPADLHTIYVEHSEDEINLEAFRTALWRLQKKLIAGGGKTWSVKSENGRYWRHEVQDPQIIAGSEGEENDLDDL